MAQDGELSVSLVRDYFLKNGGKVKRHDLFDHFRSQLDEYGDQGTLKNQFGDIVNSLAFLQNIQGEKFFVLKKNKNGTTPVMLRRPLRQLTQRKEKGVSLPSTMRNFRFSSTDETTGNHALADTKLRLNSVSRVRASGSPGDIFLRRNNSDTSISENGPAALDSGVDTAVSSLQSESPKPGSRNGSLPRSTESDQISQHSGDTGIYTEDDDHDQEIPSHVLSGFEKSWMMSTMVGNKAAIICQLEEDPTIISFKDFFMTGLHWAAKQGNEVLVQLLSSSGADVNAKSGYTPLHLATMHGKVNIINILIDEYHADIHIRDHSGKEPNDVVQKNSSEQLKQKLKDPAATLALQDIAKRLPSTPSGKTKPNIKKLGKILTRKHNIPHSRGDGENPRKMQRNHSEPTESQEDSGNHIEPKGSHAHNRNHSDPMGSHEDNWNHSEPKGSHAHTRNHSDPMGTHQDNWNHSEPIGSHEDNGNHSEPVGSHEDNDNVFELCETTSVENNNEVQRAKRPYGIPREAVRYIV